MKPIENLWGKDMGLFPMYGSLIFLHVTNIVVILWWYRNFFFFLPSLENYPFKTNAQYICIREKEWTSASKRI